MARISTYPLDQDIKGDDKWIGSDAQSYGATKNFTVDKVAAYLNSSASIQSQSLRYTYQDVLVGEDREPSTISFNPSIGNTVLFSSITTWMLSMYSNSSDVHTFYTNPLIGSYVLVTDAENISNWAIYMWDSSTQDITELDFYNIGLTHMGSSGGLVDGKDYLISLFQADSIIPIEGDKNFVYTQNVASSTWVIPHNLNKYCSVSVVDSAGTSVFGNVTYDDLNQCTISFTSQFSGQAFCN